MIEEIGGTLITKALTNEKVQQIVTSWISPKLKEFREDLNYSLGRTFEEYLTRMFQDSQYMNTIIFPKTPKKIESMYIPLTLQNEFTEEGKFKVEYAVEITKFLETYRKIFITDTAGMGKSTMMKWMFRKCIETNSGIPILIEIRKFKKDNSIIDEIYKGLNGIDNEIDQAQVNKLIAKGDFIFFLDGFDEISLDSREKVTEDLQSFISKAYNNKFVISSRPNNIITSFGGFYTFSIEKLDFEEAKALLRKYALADGSIDNTEELIVELGTRDFQFLDFIETPLMVALLYKGYDYRRTIPYKKSIFYRQVYDALFQDHDLTKGGAFVRPKQSNLDIEAFHTVLNFLGYITFKDSLLEYNRDEIISFIEKAKKLSQLDFLASDFLDDLILNVGLMHKDGNQFVWNHKSLQEYFAAKFICYDAKQEQAKILKSIYDTRRYSDFYNLLDLCYEIDYKSFKEVLIKRYLDELISHLDNGNSFNSSTLEVKVSKQLLFERQFIIGIVDNKLVKIDKSQSEEQYKNIKSNKYYDLLNNYINNKAELNINSTTSTIMSYEDLDIIVCCVHDSIETFSDLLRRNNEKFFNHSMQNLEKEFEQHIGERELGIKSLILEGDINWIELSNSLEVQEVTAEMQSLLLILLNGFGDILHSYDYNLAKQTLSNIEFCNSDESLFEF